MTNTFEVGSTYAMRWITDADAVTPCKVLKRTAKFITFDVNGFGPKRAAIRTMSGDGCEYALPLGQYSMAPSVKATRKLA